MNEKEKEIVKRILAQHKVCFNEYFQDALDDVPELYFDLFKFYVSEMPYGTAKAREGDPFVWIEERVYSLFGGYND